MAWHVKTASSSATQRSPRKHTWFWLLFLVSQTTVSAFSAEVDTFIDTMREEAKDIYQLLLLQGHGESESIMSYQEFEIEYVTMALEEETKRILKAKGLTQDDDRPTVDHHGPITKKDSPESEQALLEQLQVQAHQAQLVSERESINRIILQEAQPPCFSTPCIREIECAPQIYTENWYQPINKCSPGSFNISCKRIIRDEFILQSQCASIISSLQKGMVNLFHQGGSTSLVPGIAAESRLGKNTLSLIQDIQRKVKSQLESDYGLEQGSLYDSGSLLSQLTANPLNDMWEMNHSHIYWNAHIDKANVASYDYSALLYLNDVSRDFDGGSFSFVDSDGVDRRVEPMCGRLLSFSSGFENLHRVNKVVRGTRYALAMWFTCSSQHSYDKYEHAKGKKRRTSG